LRRQRPASPVRTCARCRCRPGVDHRQARSSRAMGSTPKAAYAEKALFALTDSVVGRKMAWFRTQVRLSGRCTASGPDYSCRQPKGRRGEDDHRDQPRSLLGGPGAAGAACGYGPPGECDQRARDRQGQPHQDGLRLPPGRFPRELGRCGKPCRQGVDCTGDGGSLGGGGGAGERTRPGDPAEGRPGRGR